MRRIAALLLIATVAGDWTLWVQEHTHDFAGHQYGDHYPVTRYYPAEAGVTNFATEGACKNSIRDHGGHHYDAGDGWSIDWSCRR